MKRFISAILIICLLLSFPVFADSSSKVKIAVIDTGISTVAIDSSKIQEGYNYAVPGSSTEDVIGHGSMVSSLIVGSESARIEGICPDAILIPLVYYTKDKNGKNIGGTTQNVSDAIRDSIDVYGCRVINISAGANFDNPVLKSAVDYAEEKGVLIVSAAGNSNLTDPDLLFYPGVYDSVVCVGSCSSKGIISEYSQVNEFVDILALGENLPVANYDGKLSYQSGTSFSTAIVSACAAQLIINNPKITLSEIKDVLLNTAIEYNGWKIFDSNAVLTYKMPVSFDDVAKGSYYEKAVSWAASNGITQGTSETLFSPDLNCTRAQVVTFMWRVVGCPIPVSTYSPFSDVESGSYYEKAVLWAYENGIASGTSDTSFSPNATCTRAQTATFIYRLCCSPECSTESSFNDISETDYYYNAVLWCAENQITSGTSATTFSPDSLCTRGQIVTFLYRAAA